MLVALQAPQPCWSRAGSRRCCRPSHFITTDSSSSPAATGALQAGSPPVAPAGSPLVAPSYPHPARLLAASLVCAAPRDGMSSARTRGSSTPLVPRFLPAVLYKL